MLTTLVISNAFRGLLLSSYVNMKNELAVESLDELIAKPKVEIFHDGTFGSLKSDEKVKISKLLKRLPKAPSPKIIMVDKGHLKMKHGQAVLLCNSYQCSYFIAFNLHFQMVYTDDHYFHDFIIVKIRKSHPKSEQIMQMYSRTFEGGILTDFYEKKAVLYMKTYLTAIFPKSSRNKMMITKGHDMYNDISFDVIKRGPLLLISIGLISSGLCFAIELIVFFVGYFKIN